MNVSVTVTIPDGDSCMILPKKPCIFARYAKRMNGYNCQLYAKILLGGERPNKCNECLIYCENHTYNKSGKK